MIFIEAVKSDSWSKKFEGNDYDTTNKKVINFSMTWKNMENYEN